MEHCQPHRHGEAKCNMYYYSTEATMVKKLYGIPLVFTCAVTVTAGNASAEAILQNENNCRPPTITTQPCPGGGYEWSVQEDRNCDGIYDWVTVKRCDGSLCSQPIQSFANPIGRIMDESFGLSFTSWQCVDGRWQWQLDLYDPDLSLHVSVIQSCTDTVPQVFHSAPSRISQTAKVAVTAQVLISPNPTNGILQISNMDAVKEIMMFDKMGRRIDSHAYEVQKTGDTYMLRLSDDLPSGVYLLTIQRGDQKPEFVPFVLYH